MAERKKKRLPKAGTVIPVAELALPILGDLLKELGNIERKIAIGIANKTSYTWEGLNVYFRSGASDVIPPRAVRRNMALLYDARKTKGPTATGCVGVIAYYMKVARKTLAVLFSVPFDYNWYSNWWDVKVYSGKKYANRKMYNELYYGNPFKGNSRWRSKAIGGGFRMKGIMTSTGSCKLDITISK